MLLGWGWLGCLLGASEPPAATLPSPTSPSLQPRPPASHPPTLQQNDLSKHKSQHGLSLPGEKGKTGLVPLLPSGKKPQNLSLMRGGGEAALISLLVSSPTALCASCTQPRIVLYLPILQTTVTERLLFLGSNHFLPRVTQPLLQGLPLTPSTLQPIAHKQPRGDPLKI